MTLLSVSKLSRLTIFTFSVGFCCSSYAVEQLVVNENGDRYYIEITDGKRTGYGRYEWVSGDIYVGEFENDQMHGQGTLTWVDGREYKGEFVYGRRTGQGVFRWPDGHVYDGQFVNDEISGRGRLTSSDTKETYIGDFRAGRKHGKGTYTRLDSRGQSSYSGDFVNGFREGFSETERLDGSKYRGFFVRDQKHGDGVETTSAGQHIFQRWYRGEIVETIPVIPVERCKLEMDGSIWMFKNKSCINGLAHGTGLAVRVDGLAYINHGRFVLGRHVEGSISLLESQ